MTASVLERVDEAIAQLDAMIAARLGQQVPLAERYRQGRVHGDLGPLEPWPHILDLSNRLERRESLVILKARQIGVSWGIAAYVASRLHEPGFTALCLSQGQDEAAELLDHIATIATSGPDAIADAHVAKHKIEIPNGGRAIALPSTRRAGRSYRADVIVTDEAAFHPWARENYKAYIPAISAGGQLIMTSTANGPAGLFHDLYQASKRGGTGYKALFLPWFARPGRDAAWLEGEKQRFAADGKLPSEFPSEYPSTDDEAFVAHSGLVYGIDPDDGIPILSRPHNIRPDPWPWLASKWRIIMADPGGTDPTAVLALGISAENRMHVFGSKRWRGRVDSTTIANWISEWDDEARPVDLIGADPSATTLIADLMRLYGSGRVRPANNDKGAGIAAVTTYLKSRRLTIGPDNTDLLGEFESYWFAERRELTAGTASAWSTRTPAHHHADLLDTLRYCVLAAHQFAPQPGNSQMTQRAIEYPTVEPVAGRVKRAW